MKKVLLFLTILAFCFASCEYFLNDDDETGKSGRFHEKPHPEKPAKDINYTVTSDNNTHTNSIEFSFDDDIRELKAKDIHITNKSGSVIKGKLSGSGAFWSLEVTASTSGEIEVKIVKPGIDGKKKKIDVYHWLYICVPEECDCNNCGGEQDCCDCEEEEGSGNSAEYNCYYCKDTGCDACTIYNCYYCKDQGCDACRAY